MSDVQTLSALSFFSYFFFFFAEKSVTDLSPFFFLSS